MLCERLLALPQVGSAEHLALYVAMAQELDVTAVARAALQRGARIYLPRYRADSRVYEMAACDCLDNLVSGAFGIQEPGPDAEQVEESVRRQHLVWLVPGLAFADDGGRLGRGGGFYDRLLAQAAGPLIGVCYEWQVARDLPVDEHDMSVDAVATELQIRWCR